MTKVHLSTHYNDIDLDNQFAFNSRTGSLEVLKLLILGVEIVEAAEERDLRWVVVTRDLLLLFVSRVEFQSVLLLS
jgi:hypothetical protein